MHGHAIKKKKNGFEQYSVYKLFNKNYQRNNQLLYTNVLNSLPI